MMTKALINTVNITLDAYSIIISFIITFSIYFFRKSDKSAKWFALTNIMAMVYGISDIFMWISEGTDAAWKLVALPLSSFIFFFSGILIFFFYVGYVINYYSKTNKLDKSFWYFCGIMSLIYIIFLIITPFAGCYYTITEDNIYVRGKLFLVTVIIEVFLYAETLFMILKYHKNVRNFENVGFASFIFVPFLCQIIQIAHYGLALNSLGLSISFFIIFINLNQKMQAELETTQNDFAIKKLKNIENQQKTTLLLMSIFENRDIEDKKHEARLAAFINMLAKQCKNNGVYADILTDNYITILTEAVPFHDIGKIFINDNILKKPSRVDDKEFLQIMKHCEKGAELLNEVLALAYNRDFIRIAVAISKSHHEKWNGKGYPEHLKEDNIPLCARMMALADVFDALVTKRCYKTRVSYEEAIEIMKNESGQHFDPLLIKEFLKVKDEIIANYTVMNSIEGI